MPGENDLDKLVADMSPTLMSGEFVFCSFDEARYGDHSEMEPVAAVSENEGLTLVIPGSTADQHKEIN